MSELLSRLKGLGALLEDAACWLQPLLHAAMYAQTQTFVQATLNGLLKPSAPARVPPDGLHPRALIIYSALRGCCSIKVSNAGEHILSF